MSSYYSIFIPVSRLKRIGEILFVSILLLVGLDLNAAVRGDCPPGAHPAAPNGTYSGSVQDGNNADTWESYRIIVPSDGDLTIDYTSTSNSRVWFTTNGGNDCRNDQILSSGTSATRTLTNLTANQPVYIQLRERVGGKKTVNFLFTLSFTPNNTSPVVTSSIPDQTNALGDTISHFDVSVHFNDPDHGPSPLSYSASGLPSGLNINQATGEISGSASPIGTHTVTITASDGALSVDNTFTWEITGAAARAINDTASTDRHTPVAINVLANDEDSNGNPLVPGNIDVIITSQPTYGTAVLTNPLNGEVTYAPDSPFNPANLGDDTFTYKLNNGIDSNEATVTVTVAAGANTPPVANDKTFDTLQGNTLPGNVISGQNATSGTADSDPDGDAVTISNWSFPSKGTLTGLAYNSDGSFVYTPDLNASGADTFTYTIKDSYSGTATATITININYASADLSIVKSTSKPTVGTSEAFTYTLSVASAASGFPPYTDAYNVIVSDTLPSGVGFNGFATVPAGWNCVFNAGDITCTAATVSPGFADNIIINTVAPPNEGNITNTATITADTPDPDLSDNTSSVDNEVLATSADVSITMSASPDPAPTASTLTYDFNVTNHGPNDTSNVRVQVSLANNVQFISVDGGSDWICSQGLQVICDYTANNYTLTSGTTADNIIIKVTTPPEDDTVTAQASVSASVLDPDLSNNSVSNTVTVSFQTITGGSIPMTKYLQYNLFGDIKLVGNANVNFSGTDPLENYNDRVNMRYVDTDGDGSTFNSSSSILTLDDPTYGILWAGLYWSGHICSVNSDGNGNGNATGCDWSHSNYTSYNLAEPHIGEVLLKTPRSSGYESITANTVNLVNYGSQAPVDKAYTAFADITRFLDPDETGTYTVANMILSEGRIGGGGNFGGWGILFIYEDPANGVQFKNVSVFNGFQSIQSNDNPITIDGFVTPLSGPVTASIAFLATDGDPVDGGVARMREGTSNSYDYVGGSNATPTDTINPTGNLFNSTVAELGSNINPSVTKTYGLDVDRVDVSSFMTNGQTDTRFLLDVTAPNGVDYYNLSMFTFATDLTTPIIDNFDKNVQIIDQNGSVRNPGPNVPIYPGSELLYTLTFSNTGDEIAQQVEIFDDFDFDGLTSYLNLSSFDLSKLKLSHANSSSWQTNPNCGYDAGDHKVWCRLSQVDISDTYIMQFSVNVTSNNPITDVNLTNTAYSTYRNPTTGSPVILVSNSHGNFGGQSNTLNAGTLTASGGGGSITIIPGAADIISLVNTTPTPNGYNTNASRYISTKIAAKTPTTLTAVHLDEISHEATTFLSTNPSMKYSVIPFLSNSICGTMETLIDSSSFEQSIIDIQHGNTFQNGDVFMPARAERDVRIKMIVVDPTQLSANGQQCILNSIQSGSFARVTACSSETDYRTAFGDDAWARCGASHGKPCEYGSANVNDPSYNPLTDAIYTSDLGCYICTFNSAPSCSTDNFAIRPDRFDINSDNASYPDLLRAGLDYNLSIIAFNYDTNVSTLEYNATNSDFNQSEIKWLNTTPYTFDSGNILNGTLTFGATPFIMFNGVSYDYNNNYPYVVPINYSDTGLITVHLQDQTWAAVDINNPYDFTPENCSPDGAYTCGDENMTFIPEHFQVVVNNVHNHDSADSFTYLSNDLNMSAKLGVTVTAQNALNDATLNFDEAAGFYENLVKITMNIPQHGVDHAIKREINPARKLGFTAGVKNIPWDENNESLRLLFNYPRDIRVAVNPFEVNGALTVAEVNSTYTGSATEGTAYIDGSGTNSSDSVLFIYGRTHAPRYRIECSGSGPCTTTTIPNQPLSIYEEFFYDLSESIDSNATLTPLATGLDRSVDSVNWYINTLHSETDGNISQVAQYYYNSILTPALIAESNRTTISVGLSTIDASYNGVNDYPYKATMGIKASSWLIYNRFDNSVDHNDFELEFNAAHLSGDTNSTTPSDQNMTNPNTSRRILW